MLRESKDKRANKVQINSEVKPGLEGCPNSVRKHVK